MLPVLVELFLYSTNYLNIFDEFYNILETSLLHPWQLDDSINHGTSHWDLPHVTDEKLVSVSIIVYYHHAYLLTAETNVWEF